MPKSFGISARASTTIPPTRIDLQRDFCEHVVAHAAGEGLPQACCPHRRNCGGCGATNSGLAPISSIGGDWPRRAG